MARLNSGIKMPQMVIVGDGPFVKSMTLDDLELPVNKILGYSIVMDAMDGPKVTVTFLANPTISQVEPATPFIVMSKEDAAALQHASDPRLETDDEGRYVR